MKIVSIKSKNDGTKTKKADANDYQVIPNELTDLVKIFEENGFPVRSADNESEEWWILFDDDANNIKVQNKFVSMLQFMDMYIWKFLTAEELVPLFNNNRIVISSEMALHFYNWIRPIGPNPNHKIEQNWIFKCSKKCITIDIMTALTKLFFEWYSGLSEEDKTKLYNEMDHSHDQTISEK